LKVLIVSDMEGVAGICRWDQVNAGADGYEEGRRLYTEELNATVRGAFEAGATEVVAMDCHGAGGDRSFNSLIPDLLDERCEFVVQHKWTEYTEMLETGCDAALFVGQHARAGA
jgi:D-amino peptidase